MLHFFFSQQQWMSLRQHIDSITRRSGHHRRADFTPNHRSLFLFRNLIYFPSATQYYYLSSTSPILSFLFVLICFSNVQTLLRLALTSYISSFFSFVVFLSKEFYCSLFFLVLSFFLVTPLPWPHPKPCPMSLCEKELFSLLLTLSSWHGRTLNFSKHFFFFFLWRLSLTF